MWQNMMWWPHTKQGKQITNLSGNSNGKSGAHTAHTMYTRLPLLTSNFYNLFDGYINIDSI